MTQQELLKYTSTVTIDNTAHELHPGGKGRNAPPLHEGFRDVFELGRTITKTDIYNLKVVPPRILMTPALRG